MHTETKFNFEYSYLSLPSHFYDKTEPEKAPKPQIVRFNEGLASKLKLPKNGEDYLNFMYQNKTDTTIQTYAQAYAGHQFGHFNRLGDGRAIMLGEHRLPNQYLFDLQLKGGGRTQFSRGGDGRATYKSMLREYLMSEAMHFLKIPSSRSLAVIKTGEEVYRERVHEGASLIRIMKSHLRVGTFQFAAHLGEDGDVETLIQYTLHRLFPELKHTTNHAIALLEKVMQIQIELVANWMRIGFIHGVMNTDNIAISGETFDYGPCAFMNTYHPTTVFSSIDRNSRYAFGHQPNIIKWNLMRFAEALLPAIDANQSVAIEKAQTSINKFDALWNTTYYGKMLLKFGILHNSREHYPLVDEFLGLLQKHEIDYTNAFVGLADEEDNHILKKPHFEEWLKKWKTAVEQHTDIEEAKTIMKANNPYLIPRNHLVEKALDDAVDGNMKTFDALLLKLSKPYTYHQPKDEYTKPPQPKFEKNYQTFCGT